MSTGGPGSRARQKYALRGRGAGVVRGGRPQLGLPHDMGAPAPRGGARPRRSCAGWMREEGPRGGLQTGGGAGSSYERSRRPPPNLVARAFSAAAPTSCGSPTSPSFACPPGKVYLSAVVDCCDGRPAGGGGSAPGPRPRSPTGRCSTPSRPGGRGAPWCTATAGPMRPGWIAICGEHGPRAPDVG